MGLLGFVPQLQEICDRSDDYSNESHIAAEDFNPVISRGPKNMEINWHDATILDGDFKSESHELNLLVEFNDSLQTESQNSVDNFISGICIFKAVQQSPEILDFLSKLSQGENIDAEVISSETWLTDKSPVLHR